MVPIHEHYRFQVNIVVPRRRAVDDHRSKDAGILCTVVSVAPGRSIVQLSMSSERFIGAIKYWASDGIPSVESEMGWSPCQRKLVLSLVMSFVIVISIRILIRPLSHRSKLCLKSSRHFYSCDKRPQANPASPSLLHGCSTSFLWTSTPLGINRSLIF